MTDADIRIPRPSPRSGPIGGSVARAKTLGLADFTVPNLGGAACDQRQGNDPELWYSTTLDGQHEAKQICKGCPIKDACLQDALQNKDDWSIRGGLDARERRNLTRRLTRTLRAKAAAA